MTPNTTATELINALHNTLKHFSKNPYPRVPNPENCKKRASVALILRVRPSFHSTTAPVIVSSIEQFFAQDWVQHGDPEAIFIKRAARKGDRWTSHVALPGGKRDPEDEDDRAVAVRETAEEIGLDLNSRDALFVGNLPERVVSTSWGKVPIMVLCPFIYLWTQPNMPPLALQPGEVASTHWVPLQILLSPKSRTYEYVDMSDRFARQGGPIVKAVVGTLLGKMQFSAIRLTPSESLFCTSTAEFFTEDQSSKDSWLVRSYKWCTGTHNIAAETRPLLLWGLTLGMLADFLDHLPPHNAVDLWSYPTFTTWDIQFIVYLLTRSLKQTNKAKLGVSQTAMDSETQAVATGGDAGAVKGKNRTSEYAVGVMLDGYYDLVRTGVRIATSVRVAVLAVLIYFLVPGFVSRFK